MPKPVRILGIDPGSRITGFGVVDAAASGSVYVASGCIQAGTGDHPTRLQTIFNAVRELLELHRPQELAVESVFMHRNADSALKLGQARGAVLCACFEHSLDVHEYAPRAVKQAIVGKGGADKEQVAHMVKALLGIKDEVKPDAADALAVALCHAHHRTSAAWIKKAAGT